MPSKAKKPVKRVSKARKSQLITEGYAAGVIADGGYTVGQAWGLDYDSGVEWLEMRGGGYKVWGTPLQLEVIARIEAVKKRYQQAFRKIPGDDEAALLRHWEEEWKALHEAVAPLFAALLQERRAA